MSTTIDPLWIDLYAGDGDVAVENTAEAGRPWIGYGLKVNQGDWYDGGTWFQKMWPRVKEAGGDRYGQDWFRAGYVYIDYAISAERNANCYLQTIDRAGGVSYGDLGPVLDAERGGQRVQLSATLVEDTTAKVAEILHGATGQPPILYGGELIRSLGITSKMGCPYLWCAEYAAHLDPSIYLKMGYTLAEVLFWQYAGKINATTVDAKLVGYPVTTPAGLADISATIVAGGGEAAVTFLRETFCVRAA